LLALFQQRDRVPVAVRRQADFFVFFAHTIFPLLVQTSVQTGYFSDLTRKLNAPGGRLL
jgi:hypothetical protein